MKTKQLTKNLLFILYFYLFTSGFVFSIDLPKNLFQFSSLKTRFIQEKKLKAFHQTLRTEGILLVLKPSFILWRADSPVQFTFLVRDQEVTYKDEDMEIPKTFSVSGNPAMKESLPLFNLLLCQEKKDLERYFRITDVRESGKETEVTLAPKSDTESTLFTQIRLKINSEEGKLLQIQFSEDNGDSSMISFLETEHNPPLTEQDFKVAQEK